MRILSFDVGIKNLAYCSVECDPTHESRVVQRIEQISVKDLQVISLLSDTEKVKSVTLETICERLFKELNKFNVIDYDVILIENQPVKVNPIMKSIQIMIYSFFNLRRIEAASTSCTVKLVAATNKTKLLNLLDDTTSMAITSKLNLSSKYGNTKRMSVLLSQYFLNQSESPFKDIFGKSKKKDDLSDAFLMCVYFIVAF